MALETIIGVIAGTFGILGFLYQTIKNPSGMTYPMIGFVISGILLWFGYGLIINNPIIYIPNIIIVCLLIITAFIKYVVSEKYEA